MRDPTFAGALVRGLRATRAPVLSPALMLNPIRSCVDAALLALAQEFLGTERLLVQALEPIDFENSILRMRTAETISNPTVLQRVRTRLEELLEEELGVAVTVRVLFAQVRAKESARLLEHASNRPLLRLFERFAREDVGRHRLVYIYGTAGVGKSFLCERALLARVQKPALVRTGLAFHEEYLVRVQQNSRAEWRRGLVETSLFVLDEVHRLANKRRTQTELCCLLDELLTRKALAVLIGRHHPRQIRGLLPALESRLLSGFTHEIGNPPMEARRAFVAALGVDERDSDLFADLTGVSRSFGKIQRLVELATSDEDQACDPLDSTDAREEFIRSLLAQVATAFACEAGALCAPRASRSLSLPRHVAVFVARRAGISGAEMARRLGWHSASSASYAMRRVESKMREDPEFRRVVQSIL